MSQIIDISFVIPVYNEEDNLEELTQRIQDATAPLNKKAEIVFIDDGSTDNSPDILENIRTQSSLEVKVITQRKNFGKSAALYVGVEKSRGDVVITLDADLQNDPIDIPKFMKEIENGADMVCGWRVNRIDPLEKKIPSKFFNWATSKASGLYIHDFNCGFKAYRREVIEEISFYGDMHRFMPFLAHKKGFKVIEIPVVHHPRVHGISKYKFERYARGGLDLLTVAFLTHYLVRPMHLFGSIGISIILFGGLAFGYLFFGRWIWGESIGTSPLLAVSFLAIGIGIQILVTGFLAELIVHWQKNPKHEFSIKKEE